MEGGLDLLLNDRGRSVIRSSVILLKSHRSDVYRFKSFDGRGSLSELIFVLDNEST